MNFELLKTDKTRELIDTSLQELYPLARFPNPYFHPQWQKAWINTSENHKQIVSLTFRDPATQRLEGFWPFFEVRCMGGKGLWPLGADIFDNFQPIISEKVKAEDLWQGLKEALKTYPLIWNPLLNDSFIQFLNQSDKEKGLISRQRIRTENHQIHRAGRTFDDFFKEAFSAKSRQNLRRKERRLKENGELQYRQLSKPEEIQDIIPFLIAVEMKSWKGQKRLGIFSTKAHRHFYKTLLPAYAESGELHVGTLTLDDRLIAYQIILTRHPYAAIHNQAYLPEFASYSPGILLLQYDFQSLFDQDYDLLDYMQGSQNYKDKLSSQCGHFWDLSLFSKGFYGRLNNALMSILALWSDKRN